MDPNSLPYITTTTTPEDDLQKKEFSEHIDDLIARFDPTRQRRAEMVLFHKCLEVEYKQIAGIFGVPIGTVMSSVYRGTRTLRLELEKEYR